MISFPPPGRAGAAEISTRDESAELDVELQKILYCLQQRAVEIERDRIQNHFEDKIDRKCRKFREQLMKRIEQQPASEDDSDDGVSPEYIIQMGCAKINETSKAKMNRELAKVHHSICAKKVLINALQTIDIQSSRSTQDSSDQFPQPNIESLRQEYNTLHAEVIELRKKNAQLNMGYYEADSKHDHTQQYCQDLERQLDSVEQALEGEKQSHAITRRSRDDLEKKVDEMKPCFH